MSASPSPIAAKIDRLSDDHETRRAMNIGAVAEIRHLLPSAVFG